MVTILGMALLVVLNADPAPTPRASDVELIARWVCGKDTGQAFDRPFGDRQYLAESKDVVLYTDIAAVNAPRGLKMVNYQHIRARMRKLQNGYRAAPAVLIVQASLEEPPEDRRERVIFKKGTPAGRVYYVEVAEGNMAWHWIKVIIRGEGDRARAEILWSEVS